MTFEHPSEGFMASFERLANGSVGDIEQTDYFDIPLVDYFEGPYAGRKAPLR